MYSKKPWTDYRKSARRKKLLFFAAILFACGLAGWASVHFAGRFGGIARHERRELLQLWEAGFFDQVFNRTQAALETSPMDYFLLTMHGFSAYRMGISQINSLDAAWYFDNAITSLRKAMLHRNAQRDGGLYYILGKAYSYKGESYADLSVEYLEKARNLSFSAADIPQYLGMGYASMGDYRNSVAAFTEALDALGQPGPSGPLLLSRARQYLALDELDMAGEDLRRCIAVSPDSRTVVSARLLLAEVLRKADDIEGAKAHLQTILDETGQNAQARFQLGELFFLQGDTVRARAEWREALRADPAHVPARSRLSG